MLFCLHIKQLTTFLFFSPLRKADPSLFLQGLQSFILAWRSPSHAPFRIQLLGFLFFFCHSCRSIQNQKAWMHIQNRSLIIPGALLKDLPWSNYYWRQDLLEMRVPTGHNLLTCCISTAWDLRGISPPRSRLSKQGLHCTTGYLLGKSYTKAQQSKVGLAPPRAARCVRCDHLHVWQLPAYRERSNTVFKLQICSHINHKKCQAQCPKASNRFPLPHQLFLAGIPELPRGFCHQYRTQGMSSSNHSKARKPRKLTNHPLLPGSCSNFINWCFKCIKLSSTGWQSRAVEEAGESPLSSRLC